MAGGVPVLARRDHLRRHCRDPAQHHRPPTARPGERVSMDAAERELLAETFGKTMPASSGCALDAALTELGWPELLAELPDVAIPMTFRLLGETGAQAPLINDVLLNAAGRSLGGTLPLPYAGGSWVVWDRSAGPRPKASTALDGDLPLLPVPAGAAVPLAAGRRALGWWLVGTGRAMLSLARLHALDRVQFGRQIASFQAVRHRLAETLVTLEGAEAALLAAEDDLGSLLAKAAAGPAAGGGGQGGGRGGGGCGGPATASRSSAGSDSPPSTTCTGTSGALSSWTACSAARWN